METEIIMKVQSSVIALALKKSSAGQPMQLSPAQFAPEVCHRHPSALYQLEDALSSTLTALWRAIDPLDLVASAGKLLCLSIRWPL